MEINSSALSLIISGKHYFNQEYNYKISLLLSDLLAKDFEQKAILLILTIVLVP